MKLKTFLTASALSLAVISAMPQTGQAMPAAPLVLDKAATLVTPVHDGVYWRHKKPYYNGHRGYVHKRPNHRYYRGYWFPYSAFSFGIIIAPQPHVRTYHLTERHYRWCERKYRSYRRWDNTFQPYHGPRKQCISPYLY